MEFGCLLLLYVLEIDLFITSLCLEPFQKESSSLLLRIIEIVDLQLITCLHYFCWILIIFMCTLDYYYCYYPSHYYLDSGLPLSCLCIRFFIELHISRMQEANLLIENWSLHIRSWYAELLSLPVSIGIKLLGLLDFFPTFIPFWIGLLVAHCTYFGRKNSYPRFAYYAHYNNMILRIFTHVKLVFGQLIGGCHVSSLLDIIPFVCLQTLLITAWWKID